ncbi:putative Protein disulfide-isomerase [Blattamonas nauphoetae]|uniref:Thioredoxin domain-containing protein n=1 Tax=Blattamonas nauphoetae TaxID=2049346 RepID=A0ABQ9Y4X2_9EUKA|nr:putative Protein disulfide-isomerase [Blattamonas nauphoetae]
MIASFLCVYLAFASDVVVLDSKTHDEVIANGPTMVKYYSPNCGHCRNMAPTYEEIATYFAPQKEKITIAEIDCLKESKVCDKASVRGYPTIKYYTSPTDSEDYEEQRDFDSFAEYISNKLGLFYRPKPSKVLTLNASTFNETVLDPTKNVLVAFTAPWCGHCKRLKPEMDRASTAFKENDNVLFAVIDAEENGDFCKQFEVNGYPTLKFFPAYREGDEERIIEQKAEEEKKKKEEEEKKKEEEKQKAAEPTVNPDDTNEQLDTPVEEEEENAETPRVLMTKKGANWIETFRGDRTASALVFWMNEHSGTYKTPEGGVEEMAGYEEEMTECIVDLVHAVTKTPLPAPVEKQEQEQPAETETPSETEATEEPKEEKKETPAAKTVPPPSVQDALKTVEEKIPNILNKFTAASYRRYVDALQKKGLSWIQNEAARLRRVLENGKMTVEKQTELTIRMNVLEMFHLSE